MTDPFPVRSLDGIAHVLGGAGYAPITYADRHRMLGERLGFDVSEILRAIEAIPLCLRGAAHAERRKRLAELIARAAGSIDAFVAEDLGGMVQAAFAPGRHDVMTDFVHPCVDRIIACTIEIAPQTAPDTMISKIFSQSIGVAKRRRMNRELGELRGRLGAAFPELGPDEIADRVALSILGTDTLRGTFGCSLHALFEGGPARDAVRRYRDIPPRTGVPYIDREALCPGEVEGAGHAAGAAFRACLGALEGGADRDRVRFWGFGAHLCLGRKMSLQVWQGITAELLRLAPRVRVLEYGLLRDDVFAIPGRFEIEVE